jgi:hypothetical protein
MGSKPGALCAGQFAGFLPQWRSFRLLNCPLVRTMDLLDTRRWPSNPLPSQPLAQGPLLAKGERPMAAGFVRAKRGAEANILDVLNHHAVTSRDRVSGYS